MSFVAAQTPAGVSPAPIAAGEEVPEARHEAVSIRIDSVIGRIALHSAQEIERLIAELQSFRDFLETESQRVQREISAYVNLSQAAAKSSNIIMENMGHWRNGLDKPPQRPG